LGTHAPSGPLLAQLAGLELTGNGRRLEWTRDPLNMYAFHVEVPADVTTLEADFQFLSPVEHEQGAILATPVMLAVHWEALLLYPAGFYAHGIRVKASLTLPQQWPFAGALEVTAHDGETVEFKPVDIEELVDSPIYAGRYFQRIDLDPGAKTPVFLDMVADAPENLSGTPAQLQAHRQLVQQAYKLFGSQHFAHYDFLMALSDEFGFAGLEHHQSSENGVRTTYFSDWDHQQSWRTGLVSHEFIHSWDGKFRRPADQLTANFNLPMQDSLLWVYEGGTTYWGHVLGARSGLAETSQMREALAASAALLDLRAGRLWRSLEDTTNEPIINRRNPLGWVSWQRAEDYYSEGELIWFDADTKIRELSKDRRSLDDFARRFFGVDDGRHTPLTYTFADVVRALNDVQAYDWEQFLRSRLDGHGPGAPLDGLARSGWKLVYTEQPTPFFADAEGYRKVLDFSYSLGFVIDKGGRIVGVQWNGPAFRAGLSQGYTLLAVNGHAYTPERLRAAISAAKSAPEPIELLLQQADRYETRGIDYHDGLRYPRLERIPGTPDRLAAIFTPVR
jgi:predicted metalloprotease with PDZ domain